MDFTLSKEHEMVRTLFKEFALLFHDSADTVHGLGGDRQHDRGHVTERTLFVAVKFLRRAFLGLRNACVRLRVRLPPPRPLRPGKRVEALPFGGEAC